MVCDLIVLARFLTVLFLFLLVFSSQLKGFLRVATCHSLWTDLKLPISILNPSAFKSFLHSLHSSQVLFMLDDIILNLSQSISLSFWVIDGSN